MKANWFTTLVASGAIFTSNAVLAQAWVFDSSNLTDASGVSRTDLSTIWGDAVQITSTGVLDQFQFAVFCSGSSSGDLVSATATISFHAFNTGNSTVGSLLGSFSTQIGAVARGNFQTFSISDLASLGIDLNTQDIFISQQLSNVVGASRLGVPVFNENTPSTGTELNPGYYLKNSTVPNGAFYVVSGKSYSQLLFSVGLEAPEILGLPPVPEPSTYAAFAALGLVGFGAWRKARR